MIEKYLIDSYQSYSQQIGGGFGGTEINNILNAIVNMFFALCRLFWQIFDGIVKGLSDVNVFSEQVASVFQVAKGLYQQLFSGFGVLVVLAAVGFLFIRSMLTRSAFVKQKIIALLFVFALNVGFYAQGDKWLSTANEVVQGIENIVVSSVLSLNEQTETASATERLRELMFKQSIQQPFAIMNFGSYEYNDDSMGQFLISSQHTSIQSLTSEQKRIEELVKKNDVHSLYLTSYKTTEKIGMSILFLINVIVVGGMITVITLFKMILQMILLATVFLVPIVSIISFIPYFSHALQVALKKMMGLLSMSALMGVGTALLFYFYDVIDKTLVVLLGVQQFTYFTALLTKGLFTYVVVKNKKFILQFLTGGTVRNVSSQPFQQVKSMISDVGAVGMGAMRMGMYVSQGRWIHDLSRVGTSLQRRFNGSNEHSMSSSSRRNEIDFVYQEDDTKRKERLQVNEVEQEQTTKKKRKKYTLMTFKEYQDLYKRELKK